MRDKKDQIPEVEEVLEEKKKTKSPGWTIVLLLGMILVVFSGWKLYGSLSDYKKSEGLYEETARKYVVLPKDQKKIKETASKKSSKETENLDPVAAYWNNDIEVKFKKLRKINPDIIGWIYFENEDISYPILYSGDNKTYLRKAYTGEKMTAGSIFLEGKNTTDFSDAHSIIYGHNMRNLSMFGKLKNYKNKKNYIKKHKYFQIITPYHKYRYEIFAYKDVAATSSFYNIFKEYSGEFKSFIKEEILKNTLYRGSYKVKWMRNVISLSTCSTTGNRFVVSGVRVAEK